MKKKLFFFAGGFAMMMNACQPPTKTYQSSDAQLPLKVEEFIPVELTTDLSSLSENELKMLPLLFKAGQIMDDLFWKQAWGNKNELLDGVNDVALREFLLINYGPWERLNGNKSFVNGIGEKPAGAQFYPADLTKEEFESFSDERKNSQYSVIVRDEKGKLNVVPYSEYYNPELTQVAGLLREAAKLAEDQGLRNYLSLRADDLLRDNYFESDMAWMSMKDNTIDFVVGPIENYEDQLFGIRTSFESYILIKDKSWSDRLSRFAALLPTLQRSLPVGDEYKKEVPGSDSDLGAYDVVFYGGDCNSGSKTIAINLPNDPEVHLQKGSRKLQLKNSMKAKFDAILLPISEVVIDSSQQQFVKFDAFFENVMFHEVAHGLGIKNTINGKGGVRECMKELGTSIEEAKADILGLFMVNELVKMGELGDKNMRENYVTFMAGIFRSVRFGAASAHGKANMMCFNFFREKGAFSVNAQTGRYLVDFEKMALAMNDLSALILTIQGDGDYNKAKEYMSRLSIIDAELQNDLDEISEAGIPRDVVFIQGTDVLGLQ